MEFKSIYNINDHVWFLTPEGKAVVGIVTFVRCSIDSEWETIPSPEGKKEMIRTGNVKTKNTEVVYTLHTRGQKDAIHIRNEKQLFDSKEKIIESI